MRQRNKLQQFHNAENTNWKVVSSHQCEEEKNSSQQSFNLDDRAPKEDFSKRFDQIPRVV